MSDIEIEKGYVVQATPPQQALGTAPAASSTPRPRPRNGIANPITLGLFSFASTTFVSSLYNVAARNIHHPDVVIGMAIFCGGLGQLLAGMWEFPTGNTFGAATFTCYGTFWMSYATILMPGSGIVAAYADNESELSSALGIFLICWTLVTLFFFIVALSKHIALIVLFGLVTTSFACLAGGVFSGRAASTKAAGILGIIAAFVAYYIGLSELLETEAHPLFRLPLGHLHPRNDLKEFIR